VKLCESNRNIPKRLHELEIFLAVLLLAGVLLLKLLGGENGAKNPPPSRTAPHKTSKSTPRPFDAESAVPQPTPTILQGSAYVIDGDTLTIQKNQVRLFGVDAPEINHPFGKKAKWALVSLCKGQTIKAEVTEKDAHGRTVAKCYLEDGRDLSAEMVKLGLAIDWPKFSGGKYRSMELPEARKKLWLADARQKGHIHLWKKFEAKQAARKAGE
jgi:endonuclease YncB( thermonuclease family)